jgi:CSLREA domain-containing protein
MTHKHITTLVTLVALLLALSATPPASAAPQAGTYTVDSNADDVDANPGDGVCATSGGVCTLRAAIQEANLDKTSSTITFASKFQGSNEITPWNDLPAITEDYTTIDGSSQWDTTNDCPGVEIGAVHLPLPGVGMTIQASHTQVYGLGFFGTATGLTGIRISAGSSINTIGGSGSGQRNVFMTTNGVWNVSGGIHNTVTYNYFGTKDGLNCPIVPLSGVGIYVAGGQTVSTISHNLVGCYAVGIQLSADANVVTENIVGLNRDKNGKLPNGVGVKVSGGDYNTIGPGNVIAGNTSYGVELYHSHDGGNYVYGNTIGCYCSVGCGNGGDGVHIHASVDNTIGESNDIQYNTGHGVYADASGGITIEDSNYISDNGLDGVHFKSCSGGQIGSSGSDPDQRNAISGSAGNGIHLEATSGVTVTGNYIGPQPGHGTGPNQGHGVLIDGGSNGNVVGGTAPGAGNWIGNNGKSGIHLEGSSTRNNQVLGNVIGLDIYWDYEYPAPNGWHGVGIYGGAHDNWIGGTAPGAGNTIVANGWSGVAIVSGYNNMVVGNKIGTDGAGHDVGNAFYGVHIGSAGNVVSLGEIAYNGTHAGEAGIRVEGATATANTIAANSIHDNGGKGIELAGGGNASLAAPTITQASCTGPVAGTACAGCIVDIFSDSADEGRVYEGYATADASTGAWSWSGTPSGPYVTATARDASNNTSEFSTPFSTTTACNTAPTAAFTVTPLTGTTTTVFNFDASGSSDAQDPGSALQVRWDWENDGAYDTSWSTTKTATHTFGTTAVHTVRMEVQDSGGLSAAATRPVTVTAGTLWTFQGQVFAGNVGDHTHPMPNVTVEVFGASTPYSTTGTLIASTTTDAAGWYGLTVPEGYAYYSIREQVPSQHLSRGATSVGGSVKEDVWIEYAAPLSGTVLTANKFWNFVGVLSGRVYEGEVGDDSTPLSGVTVELRCASTTTETGGLLETATSKADGWYGLAVPILCDYYNIVELDPPDHLSAGATTISGTVKTANWIQYAHPLVDQITVGNQFWDRGHYVVYLPLVLRAYAGQGQAAEAPEMQAPGQGVKYTPLLTLLACLALPAGAGRGFGHLRPLLARRRRGAGGRQRPRPV